MHTRIGSRVEPAQCLGVEIFQVQKMQAWPEVSPHIFHSILDFALRLRPIRFAGLWSKSGHIRKVQKARVPMHDIVRITAEYHTFEVIVEQSLGNASQIRERVQMASNEPGSIGRYRKTPVRGSRQAQRHHEGVEPIAVSVVRDEAAVAPVDLPCIARSCLKAE